MDAFRKVQRSARRVASGISVTKKEIYRFSLSVSHVDNYIINQNIHLIKYEHILMSCSRNSLFQNYITKSVDVFRLHLKVANSTERAKL